MTAIRCIVFMVILFQSCVVSLAAAEDQRVCFYLDKQKVQQTMKPVVLNSVSTYGQKDAIFLDKNGLFQGDQRICRWSLNGGSGIREEFALDGNFAVPILDATCEAPFGHEYTGVGFGDWYLTLCGTIAVENLYVSYGDDKYCVSVESLVQWTSYTPGKFPIKGDKGH